jgi:predicted glycosyltransferase
MRIWIDLVNSPHIPFFVPIIVRLKQQGHDVCITYRDFAQTAKLVELHQLDAKLIGGHGGKKRIAKMINLIQRTIQLFRFARKKNIDLALSHNSYFQLIAAKLLSIPSMTSMDFEGQPANHLAFRLASLVSVPKVFPSFYITKFGAKNAAFYDGLKEHICLADFKVDTLFIHKLASAFKLSEEDIKKPVVVVRPPPSQALYHNGSECLFELFLEKIALQNLTILVLPRVKEQKASLSQRYPMFFFTEEVLDGLQLIYCVDALVSGGGSMNREAACLGVPAFSFFSGELPAVDKILEEEGLLSVITNVQEVQNIVFKKKAAIEISENHNQTAINDFVKQINNVLNKEYA